MEIEGVPVEKGVVITTGFMPEVLFYGRTPVYVEDSHIAFFNGDIRSTGGDLHYGTGTIETLFGEKLVLNPKFSPSNLDLLNSADLDKLVQVEALIEMVIELDLSIETEFYRIYARSDVVYDGFPRYEFPTGLREGYWVGSKRD